MDTLKKAIGIDSAAIVVFVFALLLASGVASADTLVVNQTEACINATPNTPGNYYTTIQAAVDAANESDTIIVCPGTYNENVVVNKSNITIRSYSGPAVTNISSNQTDKHVVNITGQTNVTLEGFTIRDAYGQTADEVAGIYLNNSNRCTISNNIITNISAAAGNDANGIWAVQSDNNSFSSITVFNLTNAPYSYGIYLYGSDNNSFRSSTSVYNITGTTYACGILLGNSSNNTFFNSSTSISHVTAIESAGGIVLEEGCAYNSFNSTSVINTSALEEAAGIALGYSNNNSFHDTSISNVSANGLAAGIGLVFSDGNTFDGLTDVSYIHSYGLLLLGSTSKFLFGSTTTALTGYDERLGGDIIVEDVGQPLGNMACGIVLLYSNFSTFSDHTKVSYVTAECGEAAGILLLYSFFNTFNDDTDVSYILAAECDYGQTSENLFEAETATLEDLEQYLNGSIAVGIKLALAGNNTFNDNVKVSDVNGSDAACGVVLFILADNNEFHRCTISDLYSASPTTTVGVLTLVSADNLFAEPDIFAGNGPIIDCGVLLGWSWNNTIQDGEITESIIGVLITAIGVGPSEGPSNCYNTISGNWIHANDIGIWLLYEWENVITGNTIEDNGEGIGIFYSFNNTIEGNMIRNNTGNERTGVYVDGNSDENQIHSNCFFYNEPYQAWDDFSGDSNHWDGNYWEPNPGAPGDPFLIPGNAESRDGNPLSYCPLCAIQTPAVTPLGIAALVGLLAILATSTMVMKRKKR